MASWSAPRRQPHPLWTLAAWLLLAMCPFTVAAWSAFHWDAVGAAGGVLWCIVLLAVVTLICVAGAWGERRL